MACTFKEEMRREKKKRKKERKENPSFQEHHPQLFLPRLLPGFPWLWKLFYRLCPLPLNYRCGNWFLKRENWSHDPTSCQRAKPTVEPRPSKLLSAPFFYLWHLIVQLPKPLPWGGSFWVRSYPLAPKFTRLCWNGPTDKYLQLWRPSRFCCKDAVLLNCMKTARDRNEFKFHIISRVQSRSSESTVIKVGMLI